MEQIKKQELSLKLYPFIKNAMTNNRVMLDQVATKFFNSKTGEIDTTTMGKSISTFKEKLISMFNGDGVSNNYLITGKADQPPTEQIVYKYGKIQGEDPRAVHWLHLEKIINHRKTDPNLDSEHIPF